MAHHSILGHHERPPFKQEESSRPAFIDTSFSLSKAHDTEWKPGQGANSMEDAAIQRKAQEEGKFLVIDPLKEAPGDVYKLMIGSITPRPIGFVATQDADGNDNLAPFSYFNVVGDDPPAIMISVSATAKGTAGRKDTCANILAIKQFTVQIISEWYAEAANYCSIDTPPGISEWVLSGLTQAPSVTVKVPRVAEAAFSMECELLHHYDMISDVTGKVGGTVIIGKVKMFHVREDIIKDGTIQTNRLKPISRLGGISFGRTVTGFELARPRWVEEKETDAVKNLPTTPNRLPKM